ncbi:MAG: divalent metal cation transporter, partial [Candidatus Kapaibacterium sp.]
MNIKLTNLLKAVGPGILYAGAAIGGSHLIQSTRAGADYGFSLLILVILANLFKYPFFEFSYRYTSVKGKSLLEAYKELGPWVLWSFLLISIITGVINFAALALGASGILGYIIGLPV